MKLAWILSAIACFLTALMLPMPATGQMNGPRQKDTLDLVEESEGITLTRTVRKELGRLFIVCTYQNTKLDCVLAPDSAFFPFPAPPVRPIGSYLNRYPTIHLTVAPDPPKDYTVNINGEDCPIAERGLYKVPSGTTTVKVNRPQKTPCSWSGDLGWGQTQRVICNW
jgi:hypothetical protein